MWQKLKNIYHLGVAVAANIVYGFPGKKLLVIGVTGTDGKTTTVNIIYHILKTAGKHVSMISTVGANINGKESLLKFHVTTPSSFTLQKFLSMATKGKEEEKYVVLEVSSHSIDQFRVWGIPFHIGVVTNITNEHLDYHKTYNEYLQTKAKLLKNADIAIMNVDDSSYQKLLPYVSGKEKVLYGMHGSVDITPKEYGFSNQLVGEFNTYNMLAACAAVKSLGISKDVMKKAMASFATPLGRMNEIFNKKGIRIIVDYAHTPNGVYQALTALKQGKTGTLIALVGAEGKRDPRKRMAIGEVAGKLADIVIITSVDPRGESETINKEMLKGVEKSGKIVRKTVFVEKDRKKAIALALRMAKKGDIIGLFGKGHERSMNIDGRHEIPWSDIEVVEKIINK